MFKNINLPLSVEVLLRDSDELLGEELLSIGDRHTFTSKRTLRDSGELIAPCTIARTGVMNYRAKDLGSLFADRDPMSVVRVMTTAEELFATDSIESYRSCPVTLNHPRDENGVSVDVSLANNKEFQKGMLEGMPLRDGDNLAGTVVINDQETIKLIDDGYEHLSSGHKCRLIRVQGKEWDAEKTNIRANHIAVVQRGRAGTARLADEDDLLDINTPEEKPAPVEVKVTDEAFEALQAKYDALELSKEETKQTLADTKVRLNDSIASLASTQTSLADAQKEIESLKVQLRDEKAKNIADAEIERRVEERAQGRLKLLTQVAKLGDDFNELEIDGKKDSDIKRAVLSRLFDTDFSGKSDVYVDARFDAALEDSAEITLSDALSSSLMNTKVEEKKGHVNVAEEAKRRRRDRYNK